MAFSFSQPQQSLFQTPAQPQQQQPFQFPQSTPSPLFPQQQQQQQQPQQQPQFQFQPQQQMQQPQPQFQQPQQQQFQQQQILLYTVEKAPATYSTKWADLHPDSQKFLLQIEERILGYRDESDRLDQCSRLYDSSVSNDSFELDASHIIQELGGISTAMDREKVLVHERMAAVNTMMRDTEIAVRSFIILLQRFLHKNSGTSSTAGAAIQTAGTTATPMSQPISNTLPALDFYSGLPKRPSPFMQHTVARFEKYLGECYQWVEELEQMLRLEADGTVSNSGMTSLQSLPSIMSNVHDFFVHVTAKVESLHQQVESMKTAYLADQRRCGDWNDPFLEADRREIAKQEAAARRVHPTLHLPAISSQAATQSAGLATTSAPTGSASTPQLSLGTQGASSGSGLSLFSNPSSSMPSALFPTPSSSAAASTLFASSTPSGSATSTSIFGSSQPSNLFGSSSTPFASPGFGNTPAFSTPFASGAATGSGASFGGASKSAKPKSRTSRR